MDHLLIGASHTTHLKIVAVALAAAIGVVLVALSAHVRDVELSARAPVSGIVKAGDAVTFSRQGGTIVR